MTNPLALTLAMAAALLLPAMSSHAQPSYVAIEQRLSAEQLQATGLSRLSADELALLNRLLRDDQAEVVRTIEARTDSRAGLFERSEPPSPVTSAIKGSFRGWSTGSTFELENGQTWRVTDGSLAIRAISGPKATISPGMFGSWYMQVEGQSPRAKVQRVK